MARDMIVCGCHQVKMLSPQNSWENGDNGKVASCNFLGEDVVTFDALWDFGFWKGCFL